MLSSLGVETPVCQVVQKIMFLISCDYHLVKALPESLLKFVSLKIQGFVKESLSNVDIT